MRRTLTGSLAILLLAPALWAQDDKDKGGTPKEQYQALVKEFEATPKVGEFTGRFLELAKKNSMDPIAFDALSWVVRNGGAAVPKDAREATDILLRDHAKNPRMAQVCPVLSNLNGEGSEKLLRAVLEKNSDHNAQGTACYALAARLARLAQRTADAGEEEKWTKEANQLFERVVKEYTDVPYVRQAVFAPRTKASAELMRAVLTKTTDRNAKATGSYALAVRLKDDAETAGEKNRAKEADKLSAEAEQLLEMVSRDFVDIPYGGSKLGELAKGDLFELRHLFVGKPAPEIEAEDIDGKKFNLSDYRGKVVLLDFWGHW